jgi:hypothetical protein
MLEGQNPYYSIPLTCSQMTAGRIVTELVWTDQEFTPAGIISPWFSIVIYHLGDGTIGPLVAAVLRHSLTPIDMIKQ